MELSEARRLASNWEFIRDATKSTSALSRARPDLEQEIAMLAFFSSRKSYWEFFVGAAGYLQSRGEDGVNLSKLLTEIRAGSQSALVEETFRYTEQVATVSPSSLKTAGRIIARVLDLDRLPTPAQMTGLVTTCWHLYMPHDPASFERCLCRGY